ncbi:hypothetical protein TSH100_03945 [Azospirillum sp. TSH100]|uniref:hypothetical protein n=1 Tax=Azospirillum sp. TSH100 TaxID=652764 RepID=UPI000D62135B|nr:hypothetical protein [Azospirillum sp. TSH100]PWC89798.1 hypothetical protein TSH100_03945 [Azospirillum sp. TSH100]QCG92337.1 hypothetical protein E6C72_31525 [Azospirillum sp. TSH100]
MTETMISLVGIEGRHMVAVMEDAAGIPRAVECRISAAGAVETNGAPVDLDATIEEAKLFLAGKEPHGPVTAQLRRLAVALLGVAGALDAVAAGGHHAG